MQTRREYDFHVYLLANHWKTLYTGVTCSLEGRVWEHKAKAVPGFTARYGIDRLVYVEHFTDIYDAMTREKQIRAGDVPGRSRSSSR